MRSVCLLTFVFLSFSALRAQDIPSLTFEQLQQKMRNEQTGQLRVVNFWATWCKPCIEEMPYFEKLQEDFKEEKLQVLLVSLDMDIRKATAYKNKKKLQSEVVYLDEVDHNAWINKISPDWSGAIPATLLILPDGTEKFYEKQFKTQEELNQEIKQFVQRN